MKGSDTITAAAPSASTTLPVSVGPQREIRTRRRLMQHRQAGAAHPDRLCGRCDLDGRPGQYRDGVAVTDPRGGESACDPAGPLMYLAPGVADRLARVRPSPCP